MRRLQRACGQKKIDKTETIVKNLRVTKHPKNRRYISLASNDDATHANVDQVIEDDEYEQQLFDDIAEIFFQQQYKLDSLQAAEQLQVFSDACQSIVKHKFIELNLDEMSQYIGIFTIQSLEYYSRALR